MTEWAAIATAIVGVLSIAAGVVTMMIQHKGKPENALIDQLQQEMKIMRDRMDGFEARDRVYLPHILRLNLHIEQGLGPPAPKIPKVIATYLAQQEDDE